MNPNNRSQRKKEQLVQLFAQSVIAQNEAIFSGDARTGNRHADRYIKAFRQLRDLGDQGLDALSELFTHPRPDVRCTAAGFLLKHNRDEALAVLRELAQPQHSGLVALEASQAIKRWEEGNWHLDE